MNKDSKIYIAGHSGMVGSAIVRKLNENGYSNLIFKAHDELDLTCQNKVEDFFKKENPEYVFLAAAKVGGILANKTMPADFIYNNLMISSNVIYMSHKYNVKKLLYIGSSCAYPKFSEQPIKESSLLTGPLEITNEPFSVAKIAGIKMCEAFYNQYGNKFIACMPSNMFGVNDDFNPETGHVLSSLITKVYEAKLNNRPSVTLWGTGAPLREFTFVDDAVDAFIFLMNHYDSSELINVGSGVELSIKDLAYLIKELIGYSGEILFDTTKADGMPRRICDSTKLVNLGWKPQVGFKKGLVELCAWYEKRWLNA